MELLAALAAAAAVFIAVYTLASPARPRSFAARLDRLERGNISDREAVLARPFTQRVGVPLFTRLKDSAGKLLPHSVVAGFERRLMLAGDPISVHAFTAVEVGALGAAALLALLSLARADEPIFMAAMLGGALILALMPIYWLRIKVSQRKAALFKALPDAVDLIVTTVEAGLAIDASLAEVGHETQGPLGDELRLAVRETTLGRTRRDALLRLNDRTQVPELRTFIQSIIQAEQTGIPLGQVLRTQAAQIRLRRRQRAEAQAQRAPVKMVLVLVLLVLPTMLMMVMGPALMRLNLDI